MARIIGGIATSHTPTIGFAFDRNKQDDPIWAPLFTAYAPIADWLAERKPDVLVMIYNDHVTSFFFDHYSVFALGIGEQYDLADEGGGARDLPPLPGHAALSHHIGASLVADEFDMSFFQQRALDHGCMSPLSMMLPHEPSWPAKVIPLQIGVLQAPIPSGARCYKLGQALRRAIESYPEDLSVVIVGTGGLSHQVHGERCGFNNPEWDHKFLSLIENDPVNITQRTLAELAVLGGFEGAEVIMWLIMRGALSANVRKVHETYYLPSMTGIATAIYENLAEPPSAAAVQAHRDHVNRQMAGTEQLAGTYPFTLAQSVKTYALNKFLHDMIHPDHRAAFRQDPDALFSDYRLTADEADMIRRLDWRALIQYGVIFFGLEKLGAVVGVSNLHIYAGMRGETLEEFQATRNTNAIYSVAGKETTNFEWDKPSPTPP
jgi:gallate dioxygenase